MAQYVTILFSRTFNLKDQNRRVARMVRKRPDPANLRGLTGLCPYQTRLRSRRWLDGSQMARYHYARVMEVPASAILTSSKSGTGVRACHIVRACGTRAI